MRSTLYKRFLLVWATVLTTVVWGQNPAPVPTLTTNSEEASLVYGLLVDSSGSLRYDFKHVLNAAKLIIDNNSQNDESFLVKFVSNDEIEIIQELTHDKAALNDGLTSIYIEGGQTAIIDALYLSAEHLTERSGNAAPDTRRALVLITDGDERNSYYKMKQLLPLLREKKIKVFVLGLPTLVKKERGQKHYEKAVAFMNLIAQETGGQAFFAAKPSELTILAGELIKSWRSR